MKSKFITIIIAIILGLIILFGIDIGINGFLTEAGRNPFATTIKASFWFPFDEYIYDKYFNESLNSLLQKENVIDTKRIQSEASSFCSSSTNKINALLQEQGYDATVEIRDKFISEYAYITVYLYVTEKEKAEEIASIVQETVDGTSTPAGSVVSDSIKVYVNHEYVGKYMHNKIRDEKYDGILVKN